ncbi:MAG: hypothetical protein ACREHG_06610, partial [Candidatus Saccharimonadales bacterium]
TGLVAQHEYQMQMQRLQVAPSQDGNPQTPTQPRPSSELANYLYAQGLLDVHNQNSGTDTLTWPTYDPYKVQRSALYDDGMKEVYGRQAAHWPKGVQRVHLGQHTAATMVKAGLQHMPVDVNPLHIAYSKLPELLKSRKMARAAALQASIQPMSD